jgi:hypothetical protein
MGRALLVLALVCGSAGAYPPPKESPEPILPEITSADWTKSTNNLKLIGVAVHNFVDDNGFVPNDLCNADGKPLLSWRVRLLPYLEQKDLYEKFKLDEPWDGPTNKALVEKIPTVFAPVRAKPKKGMTFYQGFDGPGGMFDSGKRIRFAQITDGLSNTCLVVEAGLAIEWTKPADLPFDAGKDLPRLGGHFDGDFAMLMCDGSVVRVKAGFDPATMKAVVTRDGGEVYDLDKIRK